MEICAAVLELRHEGADGQDEDKICIFANFLCTKIPQITKVAPGVSKNKHWLPKVTSAE